MAESTANISMITTFQSLPELIKDWATSDYSMMAISEINNKLGLKDDRRKIIPGLILLLITQNIEPQEFINELGSRLNISFQAAKSITEDIENNVLRSVENDLRKELGVDIKLFYFGRPRENSGLNPISPISPIGPISPISPMSQIRPINPAPASNKPAEPMVDLQSFRIKSNQPLSPLTFAPTMKDKKIEELKNEKIKEIKNEKVPEIPASPFILHQENPTVAPSIGSISPIADSRPQNAPREQSDFSSSLIKPSLTMKVQNYYQSQGDLKISQSAPVKIESSINTPPAPQSSQSALRVVHYSNLRTPLNNLGLPKPSEENTVDLRSFTK